MFDALRVARTLGVAAWVILTARTVLDVVHLERRTLGHALGWIGVAVASAHGHKMRPAIARNAGVVVDDAGHSALLPGAGDVPGKAATNITLDR